MGMKFYQEYHSWMKDKVVLSESMPAMVEPENENLLITTRIRIRLIVCRNLSRHALEKCCTVEGLHKYKWD